MAAAADAPATNTVILGAFWPGYLGPHIRVETPTGPIPVDSPAAIDAVFAHLEAEIARLRAAGLRVVLLLPPPVHPRFDPSRMVARTWHGAAVAPDITTPIPLADATAAGAAVVPRLRAIAARQGAEIRDPTPDICGPGPACPPFQDGAPKFSDDKHLRPGFVAAHLTFLDDLLAPR